MLIFKVMKWCVLSYFSFILILISCADTPSLPYELPENSITLLTSDSVKTWKIAKRYNGETRMNMGDCFLGYRQCFRESGLVKDNNGSLMNCGPSLNAQWKIITQDNGHSYLRIMGDQIPELLSQEEDFKFFKILHISKDSLTLSFTHRQYNKKRTITDYLVRDDLEVDDRNFHW